MDIGDLTSQLDRFRNAFNHELPGIDAQKIMAPRPIDRRRFEEDPNNPAKLGGVMVLIYPEDGVFKIPLMKRPVYEGAHSGQVSLPGGKQEPDDSSLVETALREMEEEIGVSQHKVEVLGQLSELYIIASNFKILPTVGIIKNRPQFIPDPIEVDRIMTPSISEFTSKSKRKIKTMNFPQYTIHSPYYDIEGEVVWGATAMIMSELSELIKREFDLR